MLKKGYKFDENGQLEFKVTLKVLWSTYDVKLS